jgi:hypothetical protein
LASVQADAFGGQNCFNPAGCDHKGRSKCWHKFCDKLKWVIDRAKHYVEETGVSAHEIFDSWEKDRSYWYMNYYQDCNQPQIKDATVRVVESREAFREQVGDTGFRCPMCGGVSTDPSTCNSGKDMEPGKVCDWKAYGLFGTLGKGVSVVVKHPFAVYQIFMPIAWEPSAEDFERCQPSSTTQKGD